MDMVKLFNQPKFPICTLKLPINLDFSVGGGKMVLVSLALTAEN